MTPQVLDAIVYSCIAFSIVFVVLGGLTLVIFAMRLFTGGGQGSEPKNEAGSGDTSTPAAQAVPSSLPSVAVGGQNSRVIAVITAAISAATQGRGRILSVTPQSAESAGGFSWGTTQVWRGAGIVASASRRLSPSWKK